MKIAVIWFRFGPYHLARLRGAAEYGRACNAHIIGLEIAQYDDIYAWEVCAGADGFERCTVFPNQNYHALSSRQIQTGVHNALQQLQPDAVAINGWGVPEARAAIAWCRRQGVTAILMSETKADDGRGRVWWKEIIKSWLVRRCDAALVGGRPQAEYLQRLGFPREQIFLGYDVIDNDYFERETARVRADAPALRRQFGLPEQYFFACTRLLPRKNIDGLLRAYEAYRRECTGEPWDLVIAGSGEAAAALRDLERQLGLKGTHWVGFVQYEALPVYFGLASAFVHPAKTEPWGLVVNEAAASGLPLLVANRVGAGYELVRDGENGFLFDAARDEDIAWALLAVAETSPERRAAMSERSREIVAEWSPRRFGEQLFAAVAAARNDRCSSLPPCPEGEVNPPSR